MQSRVLSYFQWAWMEKKRLVSLFPQGHWVPVPVVCTKSQMGRIKPSTLSGSFSALHCARTVLRGFIIFFLMSCFSHLLISFQRELFNNAKMPWSGGDIDTNYLWKSKCFVRGHEHQVLRRKVESFCTFCSNQFVILPQMHMCLLYLSDETDVCICLSIKPLSEDCRLINLFCFSGPWVLIKICFQSQLPGTLYIAS